MINWTPNVSGSTEKAQVRNDPKLLGDSGEVSISEWSGWRFDSRCEIFSLLYILQGR